jgi:3-phosphoshikimate 1-carboxyvinyltransferase
MSISAPRPLISSKAKALSGAAGVPGDKSISHRALMFGALALGRTTVSGLLEGEDVLRTAEAMRRLGAEVIRRPDGVWELHGRGVGGLVEPEDVLDMGNAGTGVRLLMGLVASTPMTCLFTGDASLRSRPMRRVTEPLSRMGASFFGRSGGYLPMAVVGTGAPLPISYELPVASAQVKSAILLAGLNCPGTTTVIERVGTRDHTEVMLAGFGAKLSVQDLPEGGRAISLAGQPELFGQTIAVPADPSSAAFPAVAALLVPDSHVTLPGVGINPLRAGLFQTLQEMGADLTLANQRRQAGEPVADLILRHGPLRGVTVPAERAPSMIDEYPILAVAASFAKGTTRMLGLGELRVKESDRLSAMAKGLAACGVKLAVEGDDLIVHGNGTAPRGDAEIAVQLDHRIAMSFLVLGMASQQPVKIDDASAIDTSFPGFAALMNGLGAAISEPER